MTTLPLQEESLLVEAAIQRRAIIVPPTVQSHRFARLSRRSGGLTG